MSSYEYEDTESGKTMDPWYEFYGTWRIEKVAVRSKMYTGTTRDGSAEEDLYDPEDFIGLEVEYAENFMRLDDQVLENPGLLLWLEQP